MGASPVNPPKWADRFLKWYCDTKLINEISIVNSANSEGSTK